MPWPAPSNLIKARSVAAVLRDHEDMIRRLRLTFGEAPARFDEQILGIVTRYAGYVHDLPATPGAHFSGPGGLLRLGLEVGFFCLQGCDGRIFAGGATIERRRVLEPRWRLAAFIAGLCCELYRVGTQLSAVAPDQRVWPSQTQLLSDWLAQTGVSEYTVAWRQSQRAMVPWGLLSLHHILTPQTWAYLGHDNEDIAAELLGSVVGLSTQDSVLEDLVRHALAVVVEQNLQQQGSSDGRVHSASHLLRYVRQAVQVLMTSNPRWRVNRDNGMVLRGPEGVYLRWPHASRSLLAALAALGLPGLPKSAEDLLRQMDEIGMVSTKGDVSTVVPDTGEVVRAVRILDPDWVLHFLPAQDRGIELIRPLEMDANHDESDSKPSGAELKAGGQALVVAAPVSAIEVATEAAPVALPVVSPAPAQPSQPLQAEDALQRSCEPSGHLTVKGHVPKRAARQFVAPSQLPSVLAEVLGELLMGLDCDPGQVEVAEIPRGIFITQAALLSRGINMAYAARKLTEAGLLAKEGFPATVTLREVKVAGLVLKAQCLHAVV